jgi:hypothetical protein
VCACVKFETNMMSEETISDGLDYPEKHVTRQRRKKKKKRGKKVWLHQIAVVSCFNSLEHPGLYHRAPTPYNPTGSSQSHHNGITTGTPPSGPGACHHMRTM